MVPLRVVAEGLGARVGWENSTRSIKISKGSKDILLRINSTEVIIKESERTYSDRLDTPPILLGDNTVIPIRFVSEQLGANVEWDNNTVYISSSGSSSKKPKVEYEEKVPDMSKLHEYDQKIDEEAGNADLDKQLEYMGARNKEERIEEILEMDLTEKSKVSEEAIESIISKFYTEEVSRGLNGDCDKFIKYENKYDVNTIFALAVGYLESGGGTSKDHIKKNNLFSIGMTGDAEKTGMTYKSLIKGVEAVYKLLGKEYLSEDGDFYNGVTLNDVNKKYASDKKWGHKVASVMDDIYIYIAGQGFDLETGEGLGDKLKNKFQLLENIAKKTGLRGISDGTNNITNFYLYRATITIVKIMHLIFILLAWLLIITLTLLWGIWVLVKSGLWFPVNINNRLYQGGLNLLLGEDSLGKMIKITLFTTTVVVLIVTGLLEIIFSRIIIYIFSIF